MSESLLRTLRGLMWATQQLHAVRNHRFRVDSASGGGAIPPAPAPAPGGAPSLDFSVDTNSQYIGNAMWT